MISHGFTVYYIQVYVDFLVIKHAGELHSAAVHTSITPLSVQDGQGDVTLCDPSQQLVPGGLPEDHIAVLGCEDFVGALEQWHLPMSPAETHDSFSLSIICAGQSHILSSQTSDVAGRC